MANTGGKRITDTFCLKHHAISVPALTATNRIIKATTRLPLLLPASRMHLLAKWKPSNPFAHSYLARLHRFLHQHQAFFLLLHRPPLRSKKMKPSSFGILNLFSLPCRPPTSTPTTSILTTTLLPLSRMMATRTTQSPVNAPNHLVIILFALYKTILSHAIN
jgi:hypothetical protein